VEYTVEDGQLFFLEVGLAIHPCSPSSLQTNTVKSNPHFGRNGAYLVDIQSGVGLEEGAADSQFHLLEVSDPISVNPLFREAEPSP
jgi:hypothetical protein